MKKTITYLTTLTCSLLLSVHAIAAQFIVQSNLDLPPSTVVDEISPGVYAVQTLRSAVSLANNENSYPGADLITFDLGTDRTIELGLIGDHFDFMTQSSPSALAINSLITIDGDQPGVQQVKLSALSLRHFQVNLGGQLRLRNLTLDSGETPLNSSGRGGAVVVLDSARLEVNNCDFTFNQAVNGGAIAIQSGALNSTISDSLFLFNSSSDDIAATENGAGGALFAVNTVFPLTLNDNTFSSNHADANGGAIYLDGVVNINRNELRDNNTELAGGGLFLDANAATVITNSLIYDNFSEDQGGGISLATAATAQIVSSTITDNRVGDLSRTNQTAGGPSAWGGGIYAGINSNLLLHNSIVSDNSSFSDPVDITGVADPQSSHNLIGVDESLHNLSDGNNGNLVGTALQPLDAGILYNQLLRIDGLAADSPAINAGSNNQVSQYGLTTDYRGESYDRIVGGTTDMGAFETDYIFFDGFEDSQ